MTQRFDVVVIGGGIVGLATAMKLLEKNKSLKVAVLEKEIALALHQTGHNSGVIHSGIYYKPGSLKAENCKNGYRMLLQFCDEHNIKYELCGKLIVATSDNELKGLENIYKRGKENGLDRIKMLQPEEFKSIEPHVSGIKAIHVPYTGIIDFTEVAQKYASLFKAAGGFIFTSTQVIRRDSKGEIYTNHSGQSFQTRLMINCAGLYSDRIYNMCGFKSDLQIMPFRGEYYILKKERQHLVKNLIYPVPDPNFPFLGVHFTRFIGGGVEAGPNAVLAFAREGYRKTQINLHDLYDIFSFGGFYRLAAKYWRTGFGEMHRSYSKNAFTKALQRLVPEIKAEDLEEAEAGVRASATDNMGNVLDDFVIRETENMIHVLNSPSPAATASLSIGDYVSSLALKKVSA